MVAQLRPRAITVERGSRGFGLSLIYRGLDKYEEKDTGIFVARVVPGGQAARFGVRENDKLVTINGKTPRNVDDAVGVIKQAGNSIKMVVLREEDVSGPDITFDEAERTSLGSQDINSTWMSNTLGGNQPISRSGSARSFNTTFGRPTATTPSPRTARAHLGGGGGGSVGSGQAHSLPGHYQQNQNQHEFLRQQQEYQRRQQELAQQQQLQQQMLIQQQQQQLALQQQQLERERHQQLERQRQLQLQQQQQQQQQQLQQQQQSYSVKDTVRDILASQDYGFDVTRPKSSHAVLHPEPGRSRIIQTVPKTETKKSTENITRIVETLLPSADAERERARKYKSTQSLHELGLDNYPNPEYPESSRLTRKEEKQSLQNLNNRLASYIDRVRQLQQENSRLVHQVKTFESYQTREINNVKGMYDKQVDDLKATLDTMNKQYNQLKVGAEGLLQENEELKIRLKKKDTDLLNANDRVHSLEDELRSIASKMAKLENDHHKVIQELNEALPEVQNLRDRLSDEKRKLDEEQLRSADLENQLKRMEEDLNFKMQLMEKELVEVKMRKETEINEMDGKLQEEYENRLQQALEELREVYDKQMLQSREDFSKLYDDRMKDLQTALSHERGSNASSLQELKESRSRIDILMSKVSDLEGANLNLNQRISDMAHNMDDLKSAHRGQINAKDDEIKRLLDELTNQMKEYQNLQDVKIALDMEIAVFRRLLECEEDRLGINDRSFDNSLSSSSRSKTPDYKTSVERTSESTFQRKVTVSQTQL